MRNVLVVDDHADNRYMLRALFEGHGFVVTEAADGNEALDRAHAGAPDVIVSDLLMPVLDGYAFLRKCKHDPALKHVPFIVYTATYTDPQDERLALDLGASAFLVKPAEPNVFMARVRDVLQEVGGPGTELPTPIDEGLVLREYNEALVRRLEAKRVELEVAYQEVAKREARLRAILEAEPEGIVVLHRDGALLEVNPAGQAILGKGRDESFVGGLFVDQIGRAHV